VIAVLLATLAVGALSAVSPVTPIEPYLVALTATTSYHPVPLGIAAALGQTGPKVAMFLAARGVIRSPRLNRWLAKRTANRPAVQGQPRPGRMRRAASSVAGRLPQGLRGRLRIWSDWVAREHRRLYEPAFLVPTLLASAVVGMPPLLVTTVLAGGTKMRTSVFAVVCLVGRSIRFVALAMMPGLFLD
jgi:membrane protein YqaA with SNARE-associated domain